MVRTDIFSIVLLVLYMLSAPALPAAENLDYALGLAVQNCNIEEVKRLLAAGADCNGRDIYGLAPLMHQPRCNLEWDEKKEIVHQRTAEMVRLLLKKGARVNERDTRGRTPIMYHAWSGAPAVKALLDAGADVSARDGEGRTVLHERTLDLETTKLLLGAGARINAVDGRGLTPLASAFLDINFKTNLPEYLRMMTSLGADVNLADRDGVTPLMCAALMKYGDIVALLLEKGARVKDATRTDRNTALHYAAHARSIESVEALLKAGADPNAENAGGVTPYMMAATGGAVSWKGAELMKAAGGLLPREGKATGPFRIPASSLSPGARECYNDFGEYRLVRSVESGDIDLVISLLNKGIRGTPETLSAVMALAAQKNSVPLTDACVAAGGRLDRIDGNYRTPLGLAVQYNSTAVARRLLDHGADPFAGQCLRWCLDALNGDNWLVPAGTGLTAAEFVAASAGYRIDFVANNRCLMNAVAGRKVDDAMKAIAMGADPGAPVAGRHYRGMEYPLNRAITTGSVEMVKLLIERGADVNASADNNAHYTPLAILFTTRFDNYYPAVRLEEKEILARRAEIADMLVAAGANVNVRSGRAAITGSSFRRTALLPYLASQRSLDGIRYLLGRGADPNVLSGLEWLKEGRTALMVACERGDFVILGEMLAAGADPMRKNGSGRTALHLLAGGNEWGRCWAPPLELHRDRFDPFSMPDTIDFANYLDAMTRMVTSGADVNAPDDEGVTPLMTAAAWNNHAGVVCLLEKGADPRRVDRAGWSALSHGAMAGSAALVETLLRAGAGAAAGKDGMTPLGIARAWGNAEAEKVLAGTGAGSPASVEAYRVIASLRKRGSAAVSARTMDRKAANIVDRWGLTPLMSAIIRGDGNTARELVAAGADVNARAPDGSTALHIMATDPHSKGIGSSPGLLKALLGAGAKIEGRDNEGRTPLMIAVQFEHLDLVDALVAAGARMDAKNNAGMNVLMYALSNPYMSVYMAIRRDEMMRRYLKMGLDVNQATPGGVTALMLASRMGDYDMVKKLLAAGADPARKTARGTSALDMALTAGHADVARLLMGWARPAAKQRLALARLYMKEGMFGPAEREITKALSMERSAAAYNELAALHLRSHDVLSALDAARRGLEMDPRYVPLLYNAACAWALRGVEDEACRWLGRAVDAGFRDRDKMLRDPDLEILRGGVGIRKILEALPPAR